MSDWKRATTVWVLGFLGVVLILFGLGVIGNLYNATIGRQAINVQRGNFERSKSYIHGQIEDLAKYKREYERAKSPQEKEQIRNWVRSQFANFDKSTIQNRSLYNFLLEMEGSR